MTTTAQTNSTQKIADRLVELCRKGDFSKAQDELFDQDARSIEAQAWEGGPKEVQGINAIREKGRQWGDMVKEMHGVTVTEPVVAGNFISLGMGMDVTMKDGTRNPMDEIVVYEVKDGKIVSEQFFY